MSSFPITDNATQLLQAKVNGDTNLQNTGSNTIYLSSDPNPSSANYGVMLTAGSALTWPANTPLWAACAINLPSVLAMQENVTGLAFGSVVANIEGPVTAIIDGPVDANITNASIPVTGTLNANVTNAVLPVSGNVTADISNASLPVTGTVNANVTNANINATVTGNVVVGSGQVNVGGILTPVNVQGGGALLLTDVRTSAGYTLSVPSPASNTTYYGLRVEVILTNTSVSATTVYTISVGNYSIDAAMVGTNDNIIGAPNQVAFIIPFTQSYPFNITVTKNVGTNVPCTVRVYGLSAALPYPVSDITFSMARSNVATSFTGSAVATRILIPASFTPYKLYQYMGTGSTGTFTPDIQAYLSGSTWVLSRAQPFTQSVKPAVGTGSDILTSGSSSLEALNFAAATFTAGTWYFTMGES